MKLNDNLNLVNKNSDNLVKKSSNKKFFNTDNEPSEVSMVIADSGWQLVSTKGTETSAKEEDLISSIDIRFDVPFPKGTVKEEDLKNISYEIQVKQTPGQEPVSVYEAKDYFWSFPGNYTTIKVGGSNVFGGSYPSTSVIYKCLAGEGTHLFPAFRFPNQSFPTMTQEWFEIPAQDENIGYNIRRITSTTPNSITGYGYRVHRYNKVGNDYDYDVSWGILTRNTTNLIESYDDFFVPYLDSEGVWPIRGGEIFNQRTLVPEFDFDYFRSFYNSDVTWENNTEFKDLTYPIQSENGSWPPDKLVLTSNNPNMYRSDQSHFFIKKPDVDNYNMTINKKMYFKSLNLTKFEQGRTTTPIIWIDNLASNVEEGEPNTDWPKILTWIASDDIIPIRCLVHYNTSQNLKTLESYD